MKLRAALLLTCMVTVPALAMFSHKLSASTRQALRRGVWESFLDPATDATDGMGPAPEASTPLPGNAITPVGGVAEVPVAPPPGVAPPATAPVPEPPVTPMFAPPARPDPAPHRGDPATGATAGPAAALPATEATHAATLESRLRALGATGIDWTPAQGGDGLHRCRCRIPADPSGQLQRVFQASAADPVTALDSLVGQVTAWSMRSRDAGGETRPTR